MVIQHEGAEYVDIDYLTAQIMEVLDGDNVDDFLKSTGSDPSIAPVEINGKQYWPKIQVDVRLRIKGKGLPDACVSQP